MTPAPIVFADFQPGAVMGQLREQPSSEHLDAWSRLYGAGAGSDGLVPRAMVTVFMMRTYMAVLSPRPPGNLHVRQRLRIHSSLRIGETLTSVISCAAKTMKGERRQVDLEVRGETDEGRQVYSGLITLYWAA